jgi:hypothetical protein
METPTYILRFHAPTSAGGTTYAHRSYIEEPVKFDEFPHAYDGVLYFEKAHGGALYVAVTAFISADQVMR